MQYSHKSLMFIVCRYKSAASGFDSSTVGASVSHLCLCASAAVHRSHCASHSVHRSLCASLTLCIAHSVPLTLCLSLCASVSVPLTLLCVSHCCASHTVPLRFFDGALANTTLCHVPWEAHGALYTRLAAAFRDKAVFVVAEPMYTEVRACWHHMWLWHCVWCGLVRVW